MMSAGPAPRPINFQRAMVFIDGTNLFHRLEAEKLRVRRRLADDFWASTVLEGRQLVRTYLYSSKPHLDKARTVHGGAVFEGVRVVEGKAIATGDGNYKEKGVDALLVADLVYHAAVKNYDYAVLVSTDSDFAPALRRVEDFGCRTSVASICAAAPEFLRQAADRVYEVDRAGLLRLSLVDDCSTDL